MLRGNHRLVETFLAVATMGVVTLLGLLLVLTLELAAWMGGRPPASGPARLAPALLLLVAGGGGWFLVRRAHLRGTAMLPWALGALAVWIVGALVVL